MNSSDLLTLLVAQAEGEAPAWVTWVVLGGIGTLLGLVLLKSLVAKPAPKIDAPEPGSQPLEDEVKQDVAEAAREAFRPRQIMLNESSAEETRVRIAPVSEVPPPTGSAEAKAKAEARRVKQTSEAKQPAADTPAAPIEAAGRTLRDGLKRTNDGFSKKLGKIFGGAKVIDDALLGELEEALFTADIGVRVSQRLVDEVHQAMSKKALTDPAKVWEQLKKSIGQTLQIDAPALDLDRAKPLVIMVVGVNGAGKTTSVGKLAQRYLAEGRSVMLAAGDTFRAAAVEQLQVWGERAGVPVVAGKEGQDPSSVIFEACQRAEAEGIDVLIADTAGRLQARTELMDELAKVHRVIGKACPGAPHEVWLVLDATNGQNAISQAQVFTEVVEVTGIVLTKLDGTAKGGVVIGICDQLKIPVRYIGIGESAKDLREFEPAAFADALFSEDA